jgi:Tol biopolymer transport system component
MRFENGTKLGPYEILESVSIPPATEAYKATDTSMNRKVLIQVLPPEFSEHPELKQRLDHDYQLIASLKHPHIAGLLAVGAHEDTDYVVTEYLEGETLAQRLKRGPLELNEALQAAIAMADALDKAHRKGITHRALNPSNVLLTAAGVKLLHFGMTAVRVESKAPVSESSATRTGLAPLIGVPEADAAYLAPEQFEGKATDARTDIFSFGSILYEMVTGKPAFEGKSQALLVAAVTTVDPDPITKLQPQAAPALEYVVKRCLAKDPRQRIQTAFDLMSQLKWIAEGGSQIGISAPLAAHRLKRDRLFWIAAAACLIFAVVLIPATLGYFRATPDPEPARFIASGVTTPAPPIAVSPDGRWLVVSNGGGTGARGLNALLLNSVTPQILVKDNNIVQPFWSPDSKSVGFFEEGKLKRADIAGGPSKNLCDAVPPIGSATWGSRDVILFSSRGTLYRVLAAGGDATPVSPVDKTKEVEYLAPYFLPDGNHYLFLALTSKSDETGLYVGSLDSPEKTRLLDVDSKALYVQPGYLIFSRGPTLFAQPFDADKRVLKGEAVRLTDASLMVQIGPGTASSLTRWVNFTASNTGVLAFRTNTGTGGANPAGNAVTDLSLVWFDRSGQRVGQVGAVAGYAGVDIAPDGKRFAAHIHESLGGDSWFFDPAVGRMQRLTFAAAQDNSGPVWSPDGKRIAFSSRRNNSWGLYIKPADGTGTEQLILESGETKAPMSWSPDGKVLVYQQTNDIWSIAVDAADGNRKPVPIVQSPATERLPQVSPDGKWLAYESNETGRPEIYIKSFPEGPGKWQVSTEGGQWPRWRGDSKELFFYRAPDIVGIDIGVAGGSIQPGVPHMLFTIASPNLTSGHPVDYFRYDVTPDGQRFLMPQPPASAGETAPAGGARGGRGSAAGGTAQILISAADTGVSTASPAVAANSVTVVLNWPSIVKAKKEKP